MEVAPAAGRSWPGRLAAFALAAFIFLGVPDLDLALLGLLHHRSIITHSLLPALICLLLGKGLGAAPMAGAFVGLSVHLACDFLSPNMVGFAQIWLPAPFKMPLGPFSYLWLAGNAIFGFAIASIVARAAFGRLAFPIVATTSALFAAMYGYFNENSMIAVVVTLAMIIIALFPEHYIRRAGNREK